MVLIHIILVQRYTYKVFTDFKRSRLERTSRKHSCRKTYVKDFIYRLPFSKDSAQQLSLDGQMFGNRKWRQVGVHDCGVLYRVFNHCVGSSILRVFSYFSNTRKSWYPKFNKTVISLESKNKLSIQVFFSHDR